MNPYEALGLIQGPLNALLSCAILWKYYKLFFETCNQGIASIITWIAYYTWQVANTITTYNRQRYVDLFTRVVFILVLGIVSYKGAIGAKVLFSLTLSVMWVLVELLATLILVSINEYLNIGIIIRGASLSKILLAGVIVLLYKIVDGKNNERGIKLSLNIILFLIPLGSIVVVEIFYLMNSWNSKESMILKLVTTAMMLAVNVGAIKMYFAFSTQTNLKRLNIAYHQQLSLYDSYIKEAKKDFFESQKFNHDVKQQFIYLLGLMKKSEINKGMAYIQQLLGTKLNVNESVQTGHFAIDSIVSFEAAKAMQNKIEFVHDISVPINMNINNMDACALLGNLLDNAIEANENAVGSKYIILTIKWDNENIFVKVVNTYYKPIKTAKNGRLITNKRDKKAHGIGCMSIEDIVKKYNGMLRYIYDEKEFVTEILLYGTEI